MKANQATHSVRVMCRLLKVSPSGFYAWDGHGIRVGKKRVARLMREAGLRGATLRKFTVTTEREPAARGAPDLVERRFYVDRPNRLWVADATYSTPRRCRSPPH